MRQAPASQSRHAACLHRSVCCVALCLLVAACGCASHARRLANPRTAFYSGNLESASKQLVKLNEKRSHDESVVELDLAMVELFQGELASAEDRLRTVRDSWEAMEQASLTESAASYLTDDNRRAYSGEDYERLLVRVMLTLNALLQENGDAESYSLQTLFKQQELLQQAKTSWNENLTDNYCIPPIAPYMHGILREATHRDYAEATRYYQRTADLLPESPLVLKDVERVEKGVHSPPGHGVVYVIALVGEGPYKREATAPVTQAAVQAAGILLNRAGKHSVPPTLTSVRIPEIVSPEKPFDLVGVMVDGRAVSTTLPITDLHQLAYDSYEEKKPQVIARTIARRILKKGAVYAAQDQLSADADVAAMALTAAGFLWEATESPDTRCWGLLPREIQLLRVELPAGEYTFDLEPVTAGKPIAKSRQCKLRVLDGQNTYALSYWPSQTSVGSILVSENGRP